jgi:signal transduction histidine kinase
MLPPSPPSASSLPRDIAIVVAITILSIAVAAHFELNEILFRFTRRWEFAQLDELPLGLLTLTICLIWLSWRRYLQARNELLARQTVETRLVDVLAKNRELSHGQLRIQEEERRKLARELHDELGQYLNAIKLDAVMIHDPSVRDLDSIRRTAFDIIQTADHVHSVVSDMIRRLRPVALDELGLIAALEHCIDHWRQRVPEVQFTLSARGDFDGLGEPLNLALYRITQEGLTNAYKHSAARNVDVTLERHAAAQGEADRLNLSISDDGRGMHAESSHGGHGLNGMRERVAMLGGTFVLASAPGSGVTLRATLPMEVSG